MIVVHLQCFDAKSVHGRTTVSIYSEVSFMSRTLPDGEGYWDFMLDSFNSFIEVSSFPKSLRDLEEIRLKGDSGDWLTMCVPEHQEVQFIKKLAHSKIYSVSRNVRFCGLNVLTFLCVTEMIRQQRLDC